MTRRWTLRTVLAPGLALAAFLGAAACSVEQTLPPPDCEDGGSALIVAQSVPTASQIPCLLDLPTGWSVSTVRVDDRASRISLNSDRAGDGAAVLRLDDACDVEGAVRTPTLLEAERFDRIDQVEPAFRAERFYLFPGGCVSWKFAFDTGAAASESVVIGDTLQLYPRDLLQQQISEQFIDEEI